MTEGIWNRCLSRLEGELGPQDFNLWIRPLQVVESSTHVRLLAPNEYVKESVSDKYLPMIVDMINHYSDGKALLIFEVGSQSKSQPNLNHDPEKLLTQRRPFRYDETRLDKTYRFENYVQGKSNQLARAAASFVGENPGQKDYNPLLLFGGTGLGKTHLMHAVGNQIRTENPNARVIYMHSERFVSNMINALRHNRMDNFKETYRSVDALLIDDIQFFADKERSQEEFFHTFNALLDSKQQIVLTCDRYPKEVDGLEDRLKSRFSWGLSVAIEPPDLETRIAILMSKVSGLDIYFDDEVAFFIAKRIRSNVRDLEGALNTVCAKARLFGQKVTLDFAKETLRDLLSVHERLITIDNIQRKVSEYYGIRVHDLLSKGRSRSIARPRQMAMALAKELTEHSLPEIGDKFGGRDHTTVLHACRKIKELCETDARIGEDKAKLLRTLTS